MQHKFNIIKALEKFSTVLLKAEEVKAKDNELIISYRIVGRKNFLEVVFPENYEVVYCYQVYLTHIADCAEWKRMYLLNNRKKPIRQYTNCKYA